MKKIIWIFGESATGKLTLINNILQNKYDIKNSLGISNQKISVLRRTVAVNLSSYDNGDVEKSRKESILQEIDQFMKSDDDILLIKGQANDMDDRYGNTLGEFATLYQNIEKEIYLLEVNDLDLHYQRFISKDWYKEDQKRYEKIFTREWLPLAVERHRQKVLSYGNFGFKYTKIDSTNGFKIEGSIELNGESGYIMR